MPVRNVVRIHVSDTFYHVYNRGHNKAPLFIDADDYEFFEFLLERCFGPRQLKNSEGKLLPWFGDQIKLNAYCLMPNHFHLLIHQYEDEKAISKSMQSLATTYSIYFNKKHRRRGSAFESTFKASIISTDEYLQHITRYIHLNPRDFKRWQYSSYRDYKNTPRPWIASDQILELFDSQQQYLSFVEDYLELNNQIQIIKHRLADNGTTFYL